MVKFLPPHLVSEYLVYSQHSSVERYIKAKSSVQDNLKLLAPVVQTLDSAIHWINYYPLDNSIGFASVYPLDSDLSGGQRYPSFEQLGPDVFDIFFLQF